MPLLLLLLFIACTPGESTLPPPPPPPGDPVLALEPVGGTFSAPLLVTAPLGDPRLFVVEQGGRVRIVKAGITLATPFLDLSAAVSSGGERGLLGLAFHPRYATNGVVVVNYTDRDGTTRLATWRVSADADRADPASERIVLSIEQPYANHNGGHVAFGPDGMLYVAMGDGGSGGDPHGYGQRRDDLLGSLLRLEIRDDGTMQVPTDNPFVGEAGVRPELWNSGLRNPWRFSFDRTTGDLYIADVGQNQREEINVAPAGSGGGRGANYGWRIFEGTRCFDGAAACTAAIGLTAPLLEYSHDEGCSVTGGYTYRGSAIPSLQGTYFYADYCRGWVRSFRYANGQATQQREWATLTPGGTISSFGEDSAGELYLCSGSAVYRIVPGGS